MTASFGESTRVETTVAMLLAASWKPLRKSKTRAVAMVTVSSSNPVFTGGRTSFQGWDRTGGSSGALQRYRFQYVGGIFGLVGRVFQHFVQLFNLDQLDGVFLFVEQA